MQHRSLCKKRVLTLKNPQKNKKTKQTKNPKQTNKTNYCFGYENSHNVASSSLFMFSAKSFRKCLINIEICLFIARLRCAISVFCYATIFVYFIDIFIFLMHISGTYVIQSYLYVYYEHYLYLLREIVFFCIGMYWMETVV